MSSSPLDDIFVAHRTVLLRTLQRMVNSHSTAEDLLQETWLRVNHALQGRVIEHLEPFVFQTARNLALDHLRANRSRAQMLVQGAPQADLDKVTTGTSPPEDVAHATRMLEALNASISRLSQRQQCIFSLSRLQGCSYLEIAHQLSVSPSTVQKELKLIMAICVGIAGRLER